MQRGTNLPRIGPFNQAVVFDAIRRAPSGLTRAELARATGLAPQTLTNVSRRLLDAGLVAQGDVVRPERGRPGRRLVLRPGGRLAVGVLIDPASLTLVLVDLAGSTVARRTVETPESGDPGEMSALLVGALRRFIEDEADADRVVGIGIGTPGPLDVENGVVLDPPHLPAWHSVALRKGVSEAIGLPVLLEKDSVVIAFGHSWFPHERAFDNAAFAYLGTGVAIATVVDGRVVRGSAGNAGEVGHLVVAPDGARCGCGRTGCLGAIASTPGLVSTAAAAGASVLEPGDDPANALAADRALDRMVALAERGDPVVLGVLESAGDALASAAGLVADLLGLDAVVASGPAWVRIAPWVAPVVARTLEQHPVTGADRSLVFRDSPLGADVGAIGAACLVLDAFFSPDPSRFVLAG